MTKPTYYIASFSGGKDSTAMVLRLIELGEPLDEVRCCDTTAEFPAMYRHIEKVKDVVEAAGVKFTTLRPEHNFEYYLADVDVPNRKRDAKHYGVPGLGWPSPKTRWCTKHLKLELMKKHQMELCEKYTVIQYVGIAADEDYRMERKNNQGPDQRHPLRDWGWSEDDAMAYCKSKGYDWEGLYELFKNEKTGRARVSCWFCPLQPYDDLRKLRKHFPDLWGELLRLDSRQWQTFSHGYSVADLDKRFALEDVLGGAGHSLKNRQFFTDLKRLLSGEATVDQILQEREQVTT